MGNGTQKEWLKRYILPQVKLDLARKMVFVGGPRQVGKTTMAQGLVAKSGYLNWDIPSHRERILKGEFPTTKVWALDEIHKYHGWRNLLKGLYDEYKGIKQIIVTGSARLDFYRFGFSFLYCNFLLICFIFLYPF